MIQKRNVMTTQEKKQAILDVIYERAAKLEEKAIEHLTLFHGATGFHYESVAESALKKALQEWKENKPVFNVPSFLQ